ncbi:MAG: alpha/beta fold hydrolase [Proteobacteria bacterium]|nr:alpha/beta fold hydrolase [Pseudomonadota bacterium]
MKSPRRRLAQSVLSFLFVLACLLAPFETRAGSATADSLVPALGHLKKFHHLPGFRIGGTYEPGREEAYERGGAGGTTLESLGAEPLRLAYIEAGTPRRDEQGRIINAVIVNPYYDADATVTYYMWYEGQKANEFCKGPVIGPGRLIDTDRYYVVFLDALGMWGASKPSGGLGPGFPRYSLMDLVQANYRLLRDKLNVARVKLSFGTSMGAMQSYLWAILHPEFVEGIMPICGMTGRNPVARWLFQLMNAAMKSDPAWRETRGNYYHLPKDRHPNQGMMFGWSLLMQSIMTFDYRVDQPWSDVEKEVFYWEPQGEQGAALRSKAETYDVNDLLYRNQALDAFDVTDQLHRIKARTLILHVENDQWLSVKLARGTQKMIPGARLATFQSPLAHLAGGQAPNVLKSDVQVFLKELGMK